MTLLEQLELHEGRRLYPYVDTVGKITIGVGRNLTDRGISQDEADYMLANDLREVFADLETFPFWAGLDPVRRNVLVDMRFNLGPSRFRKFRKMLAAVAGGDYVMAGEQMLLSRWSQQVGQRARTLARQMKTGIA